MRRSFFNKTGRVYEPNTFIGGVGADYITSEADFVSKITTDLDAADIQGFTIDEDGNVSFFVEKNYNINISSAFQNTEVTYFIDEDGVVFNPNNSGGTNRFMNASNMIAFSASNLEGTIGNGGGFNDFARWGMNGQSVFMNVERLNNYALSRLLCKYIRLENLNQAWSQNTGRRVMDRLYNAERVYMGVNQTVWTYQYSAPVFFEDINTGCKIYVSSTIYNTEEYAWGVVQVSLPATVAGDTVTINGISYTAVNGTPADYTEFDVSGANQDGAISLQNAIENDVRAGTIGTLTVERNSADLYLISSETTAGNAITMSRTGTGITLTNFAHGGDLIRPLQLARDNRSCEIIEIENTTSPSEITDLSASNITASGCDLNFTTPSSANTLEFHEVWVENLDLNEWHVDRVKGRYNINQEITASGNTISGLASGTNYKIWVFACDEFWNRSKSNEITITTL